jgi:hypothetical protein
MSGAIAERWPANLPWLHCLARRVDFTPKSLTPARAIEIYGKGKRFGIGPLGFDKVGWWVSVNKNSPNAEVNDLSPVKSSCNCLTVGASRFLN